MRKSITRRSNSIYETLIACFCRNRTRLELTQSSLSHKLFCKSWLPGHWHQIIIYIKWFTFHGQQLSWREHTLGVFLLEDTNTILMWVLRNAILLHWSWKKILSTRWIRTRSKLTNVVNLSTPLSATPFEQSLTEFLWPYARTLAQFMGVELFNGYLIQLILSKTRVKETILRLFSLASAAQVIRALAPSPTM